MQRLFRCIQSTAVAVQATLVEQQRELRNHSRNRTVRWKKVVKNPNLNRYWFLRFGENYEKIREVGHEREAFQHFSRYAYDASTYRMPDYTDKITDLTPRARFDFLYNLLSQAKSLSNYKKCKYSLMALECFSDMRNDGLVAENYRDWSETDQNYFIWAVDSVVSNSANFLTVRTAALPMTIRAAAICEEVRCDEKREETLRVAENMLAKLDEGSEKVSANSNWLKEALKKPDNYYLHEYQTSLKREAKKMLVQSHSPLPIYIGNTIRGHFKLKANPSLPKGRDYYHKQAKEKPIKDSL